MAPVHGCIGANLDELDTKVLQSLCSMVPYIVPRVIYIAPDMYSMLPVQNL